MTDEQREWISAKETAELLGIARETLHKYIRLDKPTPPYHTFGTVRRFDRAEVVEWIRVNNWYRRGGQPAGA